MTELKRSHIIFFCITTTFFWFSAYAYVPELSTYSKELGASYKMIGIITGSYGFTQMLLRIPLGIVSDKLNQRKIFILFGMIITVLGTIVSFLYPSVLSLLLTRALAGVAVSTWVAFTILFSSYFQAEESPKAIGILNSFTAVGQVIAMIIGGFISQNFGTRYLFLLSFIGGVIGLIFSLFIYEVQKENKQPLSLSQTMTVIQDPTLLFISFVAIAIQFLSFATIFGFTPLVGESLGASPLELSILGMLGVLPAILISFLSGTFFIKFWGEKRTILVGLLLISALTLFIPFSPNLPTLYVFQFISGTGRSLVLPLLMGLAIKHVPNEQRATAMGTLQALYGIGMVLGPIILGFIGDTYGLIAGFLVTGFLGILTMGSVWRSKRI